MSRPNTSSGRQLRSQQEDSSGLSPEQVDSAVDVEPGLLDDYDLNVDTSSWLNDTMPGGFMDLTGAPDWDTMMWGIFSSN
jgi:hypothetical protein